MIPRLTFFRLFCVQLMVRRMNLRTCFRGCFHVCGLADAHILGLNWLEIGREDRIFNLGTGRGFSVREGVSNVESITNASVPVVEGPRRIGGCVKLVSGSELARSELGWVPNRSTLRKMMTDAWSWHQSGCYEK